jgi:hypothetical protein
LPIAPVPIKPTVFTRDLWNHCAGPLAGPHLLIDLNDLSRRSKH